MKKVFLAVLAAGLFFACSNDTKDKAVEEEVTTETETTVEKETTAPETTVNVQEAPKTETTTPKKEDKNEIKEDIEAGAKATTDIINTASQASKASKGRGSKNN